MVDVSAEWVLNQNSRQRKQGYVIITIDTAGDDIVIDTRATAENAPGKRLKQITHSRKYDPLGFAMPMNDIVIELYNYDKMFDSFYKSYAQERLQIDVKYGYRLTQDETIQGGVFYITDVSMDDRIVTITAQSRLALLNEDASEVSVIDYGWITVYSSSGGFSPISDLPTTIEININTIITRINALYSGLITSYISPQTIIRPPQKAVNISDTIQKLTNHVGANCFINRNDTVVLQNGNVAPNAIIIQLNMRATPAYSRTKQVREIVTDTVTNGTETKTLTLKRGDFELSHSTTTTTMTAAFDEGIEYEITEIKRAWFNTRRNEETEYAGRLLKVISVEKNIDTGQIRIIVDDTYQEEGNYGMSWSGQVMLLLTKRTGESKTKTNENPTGELCDISNDLAEPDTTRIINYLSNRDLYDLDLRGDPSIDVGDYVYVELDNAYKKALVLESELTFDGSFKDQMKVRIIDNDFEEITGNTHAQLASKTHSQLAEYTHKELMTEAI